MTWCHGYQQQTRIPGKQNKLAEYVDEHEPTAVTRTTSARQGSPPLTGKPSAHGEMSSSFYRVITPGMARTSSHLHVERDGVDEQPAPLDEAPPVRRDVLVARQHDPADNHVEAQPRLGRIDLDAVLWEACAAGGRRNRQLSAVQRIFIGYVLSVLENDV